MKTESIKFLDNLITDNTTKKELDLIEFIKKCVKEHRIKEKPQTSQVDLDPFFQKLWSLYPRKVNKIGAKKTFEKLFKGLNEEQVREKANKVWKLQKRYVDECKERNTDMQYIAHYQTWLNANVPKE